MWILTAIVAAVLVISQNARTAAQRAGYAIWLVARGVANWTLTQGMRWVRITAYFAPFLLLLLAAGFRFPAFKLVFIVLSMLWFGATILALRAIAGALRGVPELEVGGKKINLDAGLGDAIADALNLGVKPFLLVFILLGCWGAQVLAFPRVGGTVGLFALLALATWKAVDAYKGKPLTLKIAYFWVAFSVIVFALGRVLPSADDWLWTFIIGTDRNIGSLASGRNVRNEPFVRFTVSRYLVQLGLPEKVTLLAPTTGAKKEVINPVVPIFTLDGQPLDVDAKTALLAEIDERLVILLDRETIPPEAMLLEGIEFAKIQSPVGTLGQYIVPQRCIDMKATTPLDLAVQKYRDKKGKEVLEAVRATP